MPLKRKNTCRRRFTATIKNGQIIWHNIHDLNVFLGETDGDVYIDIKASKTRNISQNNYYWSILRGWAPVYGDRPEVMHQICKNHFNVESTSKLNGAEFSEYIENVIRLAAEEGYAHKDSTSSP